MKNQIRGVYRVLTGGVDEGCVVLPVCEKLTNMWKMCDYNAVIIGVDTWRDLIRGLF